MSLITFSLKHGGTLEQAKEHLRHAVVELRGFFRGMIRGESWNNDGSHVRLDGVGFWVEMTVDLHELHATGDLPILGKLLGSPLASGLKQILQRSFDKQLP